MKQVVIENPIINSPFDEPTRHFRFADEGITNEIVTGRRTSSYFVPIVQSKKKGSKQLYVETEWTQDRLEENRLVNDIRRRVSLWRQGGYVGVTPTTARLITYNTHENCRPYKEGPTPGTNLPLGTLRPTPSCGPISPETITNPSIR